MNLIRLRTLRSLLSILAAALSSISLVQRWCGWNPRVGLVILQGLCGHSRRPLDQFLAGSLLRYLDLPTHVRCWMSLVFVWRHRCSWIERIEECYN